MDVYVTGDESSTRAITVVYDIFGFWNTTKQGADILASQGFLVTMPDFFHGKPIPQSYFPPDTDEKKQKVQEFFGGPAAPPKNLEALKKFGHAANDKWPHCKNIGILGFCWGGKIVTLASGADTVYQATASVHPAMVDPNDATSLSNPFMMLASNDEPAKDIAAFKEKLPSSIASESVVKTYDTFHGWAAARANLDDEKNVKDFTNAYQELSEFFDKHVSK